MREAPDPRVHLEVVLIRLTHPEADDSPAALLERIERLERSLASGNPSPSPSAPLAPPAASEASPAASSAPSSAGRARADKAAPAPDESHAPDPADTGATSSADAGLSGPDLARRTLSEIKKTPIPRSTGGRAAPSASRPAPARPPSPEAGPASLSPAMSQTETATAPGPATGSSRTGATAVSRDELVQLWGDSLLASLPGRARARFRVGRFVAVDAGTAVFALPNETHRSYCEDVRIEVETALGTHFGVPVPLRLVVDEESDGDGPIRAAPSRPGPAAAAAPPVVEAEPDDGHHDLLDPVVLAAQTDPAGAGLSPEEQLKQAFPGAEEV
jgi:DNA polymerase-3 subunit gamma/tau